MSITDPAEEYFGGGVWAWATGQWEKLVADASSFLQVNVAAQDIDVEVKQQTAADLTPGIMGWDGSAWQKLPLLLGYTDRWVELQLTNSAAAGVNDLNTDPVPAGYIYVVQAISMINNDNICHRRPSVTDDTTFVHLAYEINIAALVPTMVNHPGIPLKEDDYVRGRFSSCTAGDNLRLYTWGYKMAIA